MFAVNGLNGNIHKINKRQENKIQELQEENNMLKIKYEILLNMVQVIKYVLYT